MGRSPACPGLRRGTHPNATVHGTGRLSVQALSHADLMLHSCPDPLYTLLRGVFVLSLRGHDLLFRMVSRRRSVMRTTGNQTSEHEHAAAARAALPFSFVEIKDVLFAVKGVTFSFKSAGGKGTHSSWKPLAWG